MAAFFALIEYSGALIHASGLHHIVFHLRIVAFGASLLDDHLALAAALTHPSTLLVFVQPFLVMPHHQLCTDDLA